MSSDVPSKNNDAPTAAESVIVTIPEACHDVNTDLTSNSNSSLLPSLGNDNTRLEVEDSSRVVDDESDNPGRTPSFAARTAAGPTSVVTESIPLQEFGASSYQNTSPPENQGNSDRQNDDEKTPRTWMSILCCPFKACLLCLCFIPVHIVMFILACWRWSRKECCTKDGAQNSLIALLALVSVGLVIGLPLAMIILGAQKMGMCPVRPFIPIWLIVFGATMLAMLLFKLSYMALSRSIFSPNTISEQRVYLMAAASIGLAFLFGWYIFGWVLVFGVYADAQYADPFKDHYCDRSLYSLALALHPLGLIFTENITSMLIIPILGIALMLFLCCCCFTLPFYDIIFDYF